MTWMQKMYKRVQAFMSVLDGFGTLSGDSKRRNSQNDGCTLTSTTKGLIRVTSIQTAVTLISLLVVKEPLLTQLEALHSVTFLVANTVNVTVLNCHTSIHTEWLEWTWPSLWMLSTQAILFALDFDMKWASRVLCGSSFHFFGANE